MDLLSMLLGSMTQDSSTAAVSQRSGLSSKQVKLLIKIALPLIISYLTKNAKSKEGATSLLGALTQHKEEKPVAQQVKEADEDDGWKILGHIFGKDKEQVLSQIANEAQVGKPQAQSALSALAPVILSGLSLATQSASHQKQRGFDLSDGFDLNDVMGLMSGVTGGNNSNSTASMAMDLVGSLLGGSPKKKEANGVDLIAALLSNMR